MGRGSVTARQYLPCTFVISILNVDQITRSALFRVSPGSSPVL
jgi:hypothetical protein